jgi:hypothetical protein
MKTSHRAFGTALAVCLGRRLMARRFSMEMKLTIDCL